jgi:hypothetical protein
METGTALLLGLGAGLGVWWLMRGRSGATGAGARTPSELLRRPSSDLGTYNPVLGLPGVGLAYNVLKPIDDHLLEPLLVGLNTSGPVKALNAALDGTPTVTVNPDGSINRTAPSNWYNDHVGKPISEGVTTVFHALGF